MSVPLIMRSLLLRQWVRFAIAGTSGAALFFILSFAFVIGGMPPFVASAGAYMICFVTIYFVHRCWTFSADIPHGRALPRYLVLQVMCAGMSGLVAHALVAWFDVAPLTMAAATAIASGAISYFATSLWVFASR